MKRFKKYFIMPIIFTISLSLTACGSETISTYVEVEETSETEKTVVPVSETEKIASETSVETESEEVADSMNESERFESETAESEMIETESEKEVVSEKEEPAEKPKKEEPAAPVHQHDYKGVVTANATCTSTGTKTFTCSCGDSYTETIGQTAHDFSVPVTQTVWHDEVWQDVPKTVTVKYVYCRKCKGNFYSNEDYQAHFSYCSSTGSGFDICTETKTVYERVKVSDGYYEEVTVGYKCSVCGQQQ